MSKAYDRVSWNFLRGTLRSLGFPERFITLIMNCVTTVSYEILLNGSPLERFQPCGGLRQGDPLSPFPFVLYMKVLSQNIRRATEEGKFKGIKIARSSPCLSHRFFTDDYLFC